MGPVAYTLAMRECQLQIPLIAVMASHCLALIGDRLNLRLNVYRGVLDIPFVFRNQADIIAHVLWHL